MTVATATLTKVPNFVNGQWVDSKATEWLDVTNPATGESDRPDSAFERR